MALFLIAVGMSVAGMLTHFYQFFARTPLMLNFSGRTYLASMGNLLISFICGPYLMLNMGFNKEGREILSAPLMLLSALLAFGWAFITGLIFMSIFLAVTI